MIRQTVHFSGNVQGVGFRYTALHAARNFRLAGYVRNLPDGRVLLVAEGDHDQVTALLDEITRRMAHHIHAQHTQTTTPTGEFGDPNTAALQIRR